mgnify:CR=1 FL=1
MATAAHPSKVYIKATSASAVSGDEVDGINDFKFSSSLDLLDVTDLKDTSGAKLKLSALKDGTASLSGDWEGADAPQIALRTASFDGTSVWLTLHLDPTGSANQKGFKVECKVSGFDVGGAVADKVTTSFNLAFTGAVALE